MSYAERRSHAPEAPPQRAEAQPWDPIRYCIFTTIALIAWLIGPPLAVALMGGMGLAAYARAWRQGLRHTKCFLRDPRLAMLYLLCAFVVGLVFAFGFRV